MIWIFVPSSSDNKYTKNYTLCVKTSVYNAIALVPHTAHTPQRSAADFYGDKYMLHTPHVAKAFGFN